MALTELSGFCPWKFFVCSSKKDWVLKIPGYYGNMGYQVFKGDEFLAKNKHEQRKLGIPLENEVFEAIKKIYVTKIVLLNWHF